LRLRKRHPTSTLQLRVRSTPSVAPQLRPTVTEHTTAGASRVAARAAASARSAASALRTIAKPTGPHEVWPMPTFCWSEIACSARDRRAREHAALYGREVLADGLLHRADAVRERVEILLRDAGQHAHQQQMA
jgi:hypothetical protein